MTSARYSSPWPIEWLRLPLPNGNVSLHVSRDRLTLRERRQVRHWWFWRRWRTFDLATTAYPSAPGDRIELTQFGKSYIALVNGEQLLTYRRPR